MSLTFTKRYFPAGASDSPQLFNPQQTTSPDSRTAQVWLAPALTWTAPFTRCVSAGSGATTGPTSSSLPPDTATSTIATTATATSTNPAHASGGPSEASAAGDASSARTRVQALCPSGR